MASPRTIEDYQRAKSPILVCDDDALIRDTIVAYLGSTGLACVEAKDGIECLEIVRKHAPACIVLDLMMPRMDGLAVLRDLRERGNDVPVVVITATGAVESAITATQLGARAYLQKPIDVREVDLAVRRSLEDDRLRRQVSALRGATRKSYGEFVGRSPALEPLLADLRKLESVVAPTVLLLGESGTGKEVLARTIYASGPRSDGVFVEVDCAALPDTLLESELFGHERGAFTDAKTRKRGLFEIAAGGTVFLDEIGELSLGSQAKLLRALENRTYKRVGGVARLHLDASVIAATNRDLAAEVLAGRFREDLFYRLDVVTLHIPPLRERREDIPLLASTFLAMFNARFQRNIEGIAPGALDRMLAYDWPGNVRELRNVLERIAILDPPTIIGPADLPPTIRHSRAAVYRAATRCHGFQLPPEGVDLAEVERDFVVQALERADGVRNVAARLLGLTRFQLRNRIAKYGLDKN
jgi:DNA-binding NtrC family response regulator